MAHGLPDWSVAAPTETVHVSQDLSELAVRLGSVSVEDRSANIIYQHSFNDGSGGLDISADSANLKTYLSCKERLYGKTALESVITGSAGYTNTIQKWFHYPKDGLFGYELLFTMAATLRRMTWTLLFYTGSEYVWYEVRYDRSLSGRLYVNSQGTYVNWTTPGILNETYGAFHYAKLVINQTTRKYVRFTLNDIVYDLSSRTPDVSVSTTKKALLMRTILTSHTTGECKILIPHIILTRNER